jgi:Tfp pilus assembly protein PilV
MPLTRTRTRARARRGHVLVEAMVSGAVFLWALGGVAAALIAGARLVGDAMADEDATELVVSEVERLRSLSAAHPAWAVGVTDAGVTGHPGWQVEWQVSDVTDVDAGPAGPLTYKRAVVTVTYRGRAYRAETFK